MSSGRVAGTLWLCLSVPRIVSQVTGSGSAPHTRGGMRDHGLLYSLLYASRRSSLYSTQLYEAPQYTERTAVLQL